MEKDDPKHKDETSPAIDKKKFWKKFVGHYIGADELENRLLEDSIDAEPPPLADTDRGATEVEVVAVDTANKVEQGMAAYYEDQKSATRHLTNHLKQTLGAEKMLNWARFRWEFMRRSPEYNETFIQLEKVKEEREEVDSSFIKYELWKTFGLLCDRMPEPTLTFEEFMKNPEYSFWDDPIFRVDFVLRNTEPATGFSYYTCRNDEIDIKNFNNLKLNINFSKLDSVESIKKLAIKIIDDHWAIYKNNAKKRRRRKTPTEYDLILQVGDLKDNDKLTHKKIAEIVFPEDTVSHSAQRRVSMYYTKYKELINGDYKKLEPGNMPPL